MIKQEITEQTLEQGISIVNQQAALQVVDAATYEEAGSILKGVKHLKATIVAYFKPLKDAAYASHKAICNKETEELAKLEPAIARLSSQMTAWQTEQERIRRAEQLRLEAEARKIEEERRLAEAVAAEQAGDKAEAEAILNEDIIVPLAPLPPAAPKVAGLAMRSTWSAEVRDLKSLVKAVAEGKVPLEAINANTAFLNAQARALKGNLKYPGVASVEKKQMAGSR